MSDKFMKCTVKDGRFVIPCKTLQSATDNIIGGFSRKKAIACWNYTNIETGEPSRTYFGVRTVNHPNGIAFNNCPFCGEEIDAPFNSEKEEVA